MIVLILLGFLLSFVGLGAGIWEVVDGPNPGPGVMLIVWASVLILCFAFVVLEDG